MILALYQATTALDSQKRPTFTIGPEKTNNGSSVYTIHMELRKGDLAENQNIRSSRGAAEYSLTFQMVLPGGRAGPGRWPGGHISFQTLEKGQKSGLIPVLEERTHMCTSFLPNWSKGTLLFTIVEQVNQING